MCIWNSISLETKLNIQTIVESNANDVDTNANDIDTNDININANDIDINANDTSGKWSLCPSSLLTLVMLNKLRCHAHF